MRESKRNHSTQCRESGVFRIAFFISKRLTWYARRCEASRRRRRKMRDAGPRRALADRAWSDPATRVEHLSDTLGPVGPLFSHRFRLGKHGFNRCFTRSVPGTGSSIWDPRLVASEFVGSGGPRGKRERKRERRNGRVRQVTERGAETGRGSRYTCPETSGPFRLSSPIPFGSRNLGALSVRRCSLWPSLPRSASSWIKRFVRARVLLYWPDVSYVILNVTLIWRRAMRKKFRPISPLLNAQLQ